MTDEVDSIVAGWRRAMPRVDVSPLEVLSRVTRLAKHLDRERTRIFERHGLATWSFDVLSALRRAGPPHELSPGELLATNQVTSGTMTHRLVGLEERGLITRGGDRHDGRVVRVTLTAAGRRRVEAAMAVLVAWERELLASLGPRDRDKLAAALRVVLAPFETDAP